MSDWIYLALILGAWLLHDYMTWGPISKQSLDSLKAWFSPSPSAHEPHHTHSRHDEESKETKDRAA